MFSLKNIVLILLEFGLKNTGNIDMIEFLIKHI